MKSLYFKGSVKSLLETFLDFSFLLCISPFRLKSYHIKGCNVEFPTETVKVQQWKLQKVRIHLRNCKRIGALYLLQNICKYNFLQVLSGFVALMDIFGATTRIRLSLEKNLDNPVEYFNFMWSIASTLMHVAFYFVLWTKQHHFVKAVEIFRKSFFKRHNNVTKNLPCVRYR